MSRVEVPADLPAAEASSRPGLSRAVTHGSFWMMLSAAIQRGASFAAQIVLGWLLTERDFGIFALAISISALTGALRDGGVRQLLIQRHADYERLLGPTFWMALAFNALTGLLLAIAAPTIASAFGEPALVSLIVILAIAQPLGTPSAILTARLAIDLRFREAGRIAAVSSLVRYLGTIALAKAGFGPLSFVLPLPVLSIIEGGMAYAYTREKPWSLPANVRTWLRMLTEARWIIIGTFGIAALNLGAALTIKPFVSTAIVGVYYFAFQVIVQVGMLLSANILQVLFPAFARINDDPARLSAAASRALRQLMLIATPMCLGLAAIFGPVELLVWHGKWRAAAEAVRAIGLLYPAVIASSVSLALLQAAGRFRASGLALLAMGVASLGGAMVGAMISGTAIGIAIFTSVATGAVSLAVTWDTMRRTGVSGKDILGALVPAWLVSCSAFAASYGLDRLLGERAAPALIRAAASAVLFVAIFGVTARLAIPSHLEEALSVMPSRMRGLAARLLRIGVASPVVAGGAEAIGKSSPS
ncbi:MAG TPA: oligosaccharide flippase family protein [Gemmatimonadaceae bacterium]